MFLEPPSIGVVAPTCGSVSLYEDPPPLPAYSPPLPTLTGMGNTYESMFEKQDVDGRRHSAIKCLTDEGLLR